MKRFFLKTYLTNRLFSPSACPSVLMSGNTIAGKWEMERTPHLFKWSLLLTDSH